MAGRVTPITPTRKAKIRTLTAEYRREVRKNPGQRLVNPRNRL